MKRKVSKKKQPTKPPRVRPVILHPEFQRVLARMREAFGSSSVILPAPELYLGLARLLIDEALQLRHGRRPCP